MSSIGKVRKTYDVDARSGSVTYRHSVKIGDEVLEVQHMVARSVQFNGGHPVEYVDRGLQRDIMQAIEARIYGGQQ